MSATPPLCPTCGQAIPDAAAAAERAALRLALQFEAASTHYDCGFCAQAPQEHEAFCLAAGWQEAKGTPQATASALLVADQCVNDGPAFGVCFGCNNDWTERGDGCAPDCALWAYRLARGLFKERTGGTRP